MKYQIILLCTFSALISNAAVLCAQVPSELLQERKELDSRAADIEQQRTALVAEQKKLYTQRDELYDKERSLLEKRTRLIANNDAKEASLARRAHTLSLERKAITDEIDAFNDEVQGVTRLNDAYKREHARWVNAYKHAEIHARGEVFKPFVDPFVNHGRIPTATQIRPDWDLWVNGVAWRILYGLDPVRYPLDRKDYWAKTDWDATATAFNNLVNDLDDRGKALDKRREALDTRQSRYTQQAQRFDLDAQAYERELAQSKRDWKDEQENLSAQVVDLNKSWRSLEARIEEWENKSGQLEDQLADWSDRYAAHVATSKSQVIIADETRQELETVGRSLRVADKFLKWLAHGTTVAAVFKRNPGLATAAEFFSRISDTMSKMTAALAGFLEIEDVTAAQSAAKEFSAQHESTSSGFQKAISALRSEVDAIEVGIVLPRHEFAVTANLLRTQPDEAVSRLVREAKLINQNISDLTELIAYLEELELRARGAKEVSKAVRDGFAKAGLLKALEFDSLAIQCNGVAWAAARKRKEAEDALTIEKRRFENLRTNLKTFWNVEITVEPGGGPVDFGITNR